jgi:TRIAD3 protein (E3 ubiquitin-protein ligase RNF216)
MLRSSFANLLVKDINQVLADNNNTIFSSYLKLAQKEADQVLKPKKRPSKSNPEWDVDHLDSRIEQATTEAERLAFEELKAVRALMADLLNDRQRAQQLEQEEADNFTKAVLEGTTSECECCCDEFALNRMVHCNGETLHWFCRNCARLNAETQIGLSKFELNCMSMDGCTASFSKGQKDIFLEEKTAIALERIEQQTALRLAGIENLETCPFCPYAAEYPPVESDKEFRCERPDCNIVSCRLCRRETHVPKTCAEVALEEVYSGRRAIEEAMSAALIRKCNKCKSDLSFATSSELMWAGGTPFIKESGCNKMMCTQSGCHNVQCYICNKSCDYAHFNDPKRGGKTGNCPLFDASVEERHQDEVRRAEEEARRQALEEHPDIAADVFEIKVSDKVKEDEEKRRRRQLPAPQAMIHGMLPGHGVIPGYPPPGVIPQPLQG